MASNFDQQRMVAQLASAFGVIALLLAAIGLYGLMAYMVACRTGEIGVRMALGADRLNIVRLVLRGAFLLLAIGLLVGIPPGHRRGTPDGRAVIRDTQLGSVGVRVFNSCARGLRRSRQYSPGT